MIKGVWKKDKTSSLNSWEDYSLYFFDSMDYIDKARTIPASFPNFRTGDLVSSGWAESDSDYNSSEPTTAYNYPGLAFYDETTDRITFKISLNTVAGQYDANVPLLPTGGNILGANSVIDLVVNGASNHGLSASFKILTSGSVILLEDNTQLLGYVTLMNHLDDEILGLQYFDGLLDGVNNIEWTCTLDAWTDAEITINKADFWSRDGFAPEI